MFSSTSSLPHPNQILIADIHFKFEYANIILFDCRFERFRVPLGAFWGGHGSILEGLGGSCGASWGSRGTPWEGPGGAFPHVVFRGGPGRGSGRLMADNVSKTRGVHFPLF